MTSPPGTVDRVLSVTGEILDETGEASLRLADVAVRACVSVGSLYHHFGSRRGLIRATRQHQFVESIPKAAGAELEFIAASVSREDFVERLGITLEQSQSPTRARARRRRLELLGAAASRPSGAAAIRATQTAYLDLAERTAVAAKERGWLRADLEPRAFAWFLHVMSMGRVLAELDERSADRDSLNHVITSAINGLMSDDAADTTRSLV